MAYQAFNKLKQKVILPASIRWSLQATLPATLPGNYSHERGLPHPGFLGREIRKPNGHTSRAVEGTIMLLCLPGHDGVHRVPARFTPGLPNRYPRYSGQKRKRWRCSRMCRNRSQTTVGAQTGEAKESHKGHGVNEPFDYAGKAISEGCACGSAIFIYMYIHCFWYYTAQSGGFVAVGFSPEHRYHNTTEAVVSRALGRVSTRGCFSRNGGVLDVDPK
jgi:hypothetical protein